KFGEMARALPLGEVGGSEDENQDELQGRENGRQSQRDPGARYAQESEGQDRSAGWRDQALGLMRTINTGGDENENQDGLQGREIVRQSQRDNGARYAQEPEGQDRGAGRRDQALGRS